MKLTEVAALMRGIAPVIRESRDSQDRRVDSIHAELNARLDALIGRVEKTAQQVAAMNGRISAIERKFLAKD